MDPQYKLVVLKFLIQNFHKNLDYDCDILGLVFDVKIVYISCTL